MIVPIIFRETWEPEYFVMYCKANKLDGGLVKKQD